MLGIGSLSRCPAAGAHGALCSASQHRTASNGRESVRPATMNTRFSNCRIGAPVSGFGEGGRASRRSRSSTPRAAADGGSGVGAISQMSTVDAVGSRVGSELEAETAPRSEDDDDVLIELKNVHKRFGSKKVLSGASFKIRRGEAVGIIGPSGTGKSTILKIMAGLLEPDMGEVFICGTPRQGLVGDDPAGQLRVGMVFQSASLFDSLTVGENVGFVLYEHSDLPDDRIQELVKDSLDKVGLKGAADRYPAQLSGGMKKRAALARAIISDDSAGKESAEEVVMYDEPTAGLDPIASTVIEDLMRSLHTKGTKKKGGISSYVVVTHQHSTIRRAVDRLVFLYEGKVVWEGKSEDFDTSDEPIVRQFARGDLSGPISY